MTLDPLHRLWRLGVVVVGSVLFLLAAHAASAPDALSASLLGMRYDQVRTTFSSCNTTSSMFSLSCRLTVLDEQAEVEFDFGAGRQVQQVHIAFARALTNEQATSIFNRVSSRLHRQFRLVTEQRLQDGMRRLFVEPERMTASALLLPNNAAPTQVTVDFSLLAPVTP